MRGNLTKLLNVTFTSLLCVIIYPLHFFLDVVTIHIPGILRKGSFPVYVEIITVRQTI